MTSSRMKDSSFLLPSNQKIYFHQEFDYDFMQLHYKESNYRLRKIFLESKLSPYFKSDSLRKVFFDRIYRGVNGYLLKSNQQSVGEYFESAVYGEFLNAFIAWLIWSEMKPYVIDWIENEIAFMASNSPANAPKEYEVNFEKKNIRTYRKNSRSLTEWFSFSGALPLYRSYNGIGISKRNTDALPRDLGFSVIVTPEFSLRKNKPIVGRFYLGVSRRTDYFRLDYQDSLFVPKKYIQDSIKNYYLLNNDSDKILNFRDISLSLNLNLLFYRKFSLMLGVGYDIFQNNGILFTKNDSDNTAHHLDEPIGTKLNQNYFERTFVSSNYKGRMNYRFRLSTVRAIEFGRHQMGVNAYIDAHYFQRNFNLSSDHPFYQKDGQSYIPFSPMTLEQHSVSVYFGLSVAF